MEEGLLELDCKLHIAGDCLMYVSSRAVSNEEGSWVKVMQDLVQELSDTVDLLCCCELALLL